MGKGLISSGATAALVVLFFVPRLLAGAEVRLGVAGFARQVPPSEPQSDCTTGDCNGEGGVTVDELIRGVSIALGAASLEQCKAFDSNADGKVTIDELVTAVNNALLCAAGAAPTITATEIRTDSPTPTRSATGTLSPTGTWTRAQTVTATATRTASYTLSSTATETPPSTSTRTPTSIYTGTATSTPTATHTRTASVTATLASTWTPTRLPTPSPASTSSPTVTQGPGCGAEECVELRGRVMVPAQGAGGNANGLVGAPQRTVRAYRCDHRSECFRSDEARTLLGEGETDDSGYYLILVAAREVSPTTCVFAISDVGGPQAAVEYRRACVGIVLGPPGSSASTGGGGQESSSFEEALLDPTSEGSVRVLDRVGAEQIDNSRVTELEQRVRASQRALYSHLDYQTAADRGDGVASDALCGVYVTNQSWMRVAVIDPAILTMIGWLDDQPNPTAVALSRDCLRLAVLDSSGEVAVYETESHSLIAAAPVRPWGAGLAAGYRGDVLYVVNRNYWSLEVVDVTGGKVSAVVPLGGSPADIDVSVDGQRAYVALLDGRVAVVDVSGVEIAKVVDVIDASDGVEGLVPSFGGVLSSIEVGPNARAYVTAYDRGALFVIDLERLAVIAAISGLSGPRSVDTDSRGELAYVLEEAADRVSVVDLASISVVSRVAVGHSPVAAELSADDFSLYVTNQLSNAVSVIDTVTNTVAATILVGTQPGALTAGRR
jgi:YVTN family beta-propeller protein